ncbi:MAG: hypothetical protein RLZZ501_2175 [Pseudomonadota bacterium]|jgi:cobalamin biosynthetic protein CobC
MSGSSAALPPHGGDLAAATARWGRPAGGWLDLSTGINPQPYPLPPLSEADWSCLPGDEAGQALLAAARRAFAAPERMRLVAASGGQALIQQLPWLRRPGPVTILSPTYAEHGRAWEAAGHAVRYAADPAGADPAGVLVVVNPNNPDGRRLVPAQLAELAGRFAAAGGLVVVDEAFADPTPDLSLIPLAPAGAVVLRSFGKFYGRAGLRLGLLATVEAGLAEALAARLGPWAVSGPALAVGAAAYDDTAWAEATRHRLAADSARLETLLGAAGFAPVGGTALFSLVAHPRAGEWWERLGRQGILVRAFADRSDWLRFGLPGGAADWARLARALAG